MTYYNLLDKDRLLYTQCNEKFRIRCPICISEKKFLGHCKIGRSFPSIWSHIKHDHHDIYPDQLDEIIFLLNCLYTVYEKKIVTEWPDLVAKQTAASSSFQINGRSIRRDMNEKLEEIARLLEGQSELYPNYKIKQLMRLIGVVLGPVDIRTRKKYFEIIVNFSEKNYENGTINVTNFCNSLIIV